MTKTARILALLIVAMSFTHDPVLSKQTSVPEPHAPRHVPADAAPVAGRPESDPPASHVLRARGDTSAQATAPALSPNVHAHDGVVLTGASTAHEAQVAWAIGRFAAADLRLPHVEIYFHDHKAPCDGYAGAFRQNRVPLVIDVCVANKMVVLHELAHAWEKSNLDDGTREAFMALRGLEAWNTPDVAWDRRGVEDLAEVLVWGLLEYSSGSGPEGALREEAFELVTGVGPPRTREDVATPSPIEPTVGDYS